MNGGKWWAGILTGIGLILMSYRVYQRYFSPVGEIIFWDVGQGDSILLKLPRGKNLLIDTGGGPSSPRMGEELARELSRQGILRLDTLIISHTDSDHTQGAFGLFRKIQIEKLWFSSALQSVPAASERLKRLLAEAESRGTLTEGFLKKRQWNFPNGVLKVTPSLSVKPLKSNNLGLVAELELYGCRFLFPGDIEKEAERAYWNGTGKPLTVLKVAHHGSRTSSQREFLKRFQPHYAVVSVGALNTYGHPRQEVLNRLRFFGATVLRTDFHGYISFSVYPSGELRCRNALGSCGTTQCRR